MAVKHLLTPVILSAVILFYFSRDDSHVDYGPLTCNDDSLELKDKVIVVTGANRGIGYQIALEVARRGARVVLGCRDPWSARKARDKIVSITNNTRVSIIGLDLARMKHVTTFVWNLRDKFEFDHVDVIINNAATTPDSDQRQETSEGVEKILATNFLGPFHLAKSLQPLLSKDGIIINMVDNVTDITDVDNIKSDYDASSLYARSKHYLHLITSEMAARWSSARVYAVYPCQVWTSLHSSLPHAVSHWLLWLLSPLLGQSQLREAARTVVWLAGGGAAQGAHVSGSTWHSCQMVTTDHDTGQARLLWEKSEELIKICIEMSSQSTIYLFFRLNYIE